MGADSEGRPRQFQVTTAEMAHRRLMSAQVSDEEAALWSAFKVDGSAHARERLFHRYLPLARQLATRYRRVDTANAIDYEDLVQFATTGLLEAIDRFKPELSVPFRFFGNRRIIGSILNGVARHSEINQQISFRKRVARERLASLRRVSGSETSLGETLSILGEIAAEIALGLMIEHERIDSVDARDRPNNAYETLAWKQTIVQLATELDRLPERQRQIIQLHYQEHVTFDQLGQLFGVTKGRISQLHKAAIALLRKRLLQSTAFMLEG